MSEISKQHESSQENGSEADLYDRSVADDSTAPEKAKSERPVVESNSSNYGASSVVGDQGDA